MYKIERTDGKVCGLPKEDYFIGYITREAYLENLDETYIGEREDEAERITEPWVSVCGGTYEDVSCVKAISR